GELADRLLHAAHFVLGEVEEALLGERLQALSVLAVDVLPVELLADRRLEQVLQVAHAAVDVLLEPLVHLLGLAGELTPHAVELVADVVQAERTGERVGEAPFLEAVLDLAELATLRGLAQQLLEATGVGLEQRFGEGRELDALLFQELLELLEEFLEVL